MSFLDEHPIDWQDLLEALPDGSAILDESGLMLGVNHKLTQVTGYSRDELVGQNVQMLVPMRHQDAESTARREHARNPDATLIWSDMDLTVLRRDGTELSVDFTLSGLVHDGRSWAVASIRDNSARKAAELAVLQAEQQFRLVFEENMSPMMVTDLEDQITNVNPAFCRMIGSSREELLGKDSKLFTHPDDLGIASEAHRRLAEGRVAQARYIKRYLHKDGKIIFVEVSKSPARDPSGKTLYYVISERDITEEQALTAQLSHQALHDPLTGLANRALFEDRFEQARARIARKGGIGAVILVDLDDFKWVNDTLGHFVGDDLLVAITKRLEEGTRASDTLCRFGGDEFLYLAEGLTTPDEAEIIAARILAAFDEPVAVGDTSIQQRASLGVVILGEENAESTTIIQEVDAALYEAKHGGKGRHVVYVPGMEQLAVSRYSLVEELRRAHEVGDLSMHYQPIVELSSRQIVGFEALMRWQHPARGWVPPSVFIPLAEQSDLILELGTFALRTVVAEAVSWATPSGSARAPYVSVNLSAHQFLDPHLIQTIEEALSTSGLAPQRLMIEITESVALLEATDTLAILDHLKRIGVTVALDDFGTGYSSLSYLARLNPMTIKIDQTFVRPPHESVHNDRLLETIILLGQRLNMTIIAEGIETDAQLERLRALGCDLGQGYLFSPGVPAESVASLIEELG